ncbi:MAG: hypothetical protein KBA95_01730 [Acidobacteria bacterium]|nr:hypothetical protein [Acidobacteriota bacterium]
MMTDTELRQQGIALASRMQAYLAGRAAHLAERAREGRASARQVNDARAAAAASARAVRNLKRRAR